MEKLSSALFYLIRLEPNYLTFIPNFWKQLSHQNRLPEDFVDLHKLDGVLLLIADPPPTISTTGLKLATHWEKVQQQKQLEGKNKVIKLWFLQQEEAIMGRVCYQLGYPI